MNRFTERRKFSPEQRLADAYEFIEDPGNWSALDGRRALLMQILRPSGADAEATNENPLETTMSHIRFHKGIPIAVVTDDGKVRKVQERPEDREFFDSEGFIGVKPPHDPEVPADEGTLRHRVRNAISANAGVSLKLVDQAAENVMEIVATELQKARAEAERQIDGWITSAAEAKEETRSVRAKLAAVRAWQLSWSDSEDHLLLLPEASAELVAILRSQEPLTGQEQP